MNTKQKRSVKTEYEQYSIKDDPEILADLAMTITTKFLWPNYIFTEQEYFNSRKYIFRHFDNVHDPYKKYREFCFTIFYTRQQLLNFPGDGISVPLKAWLKKDLNTALLNFQTLNKNYKNIELFSPALKAFPDAIFEMTYNSSRKNCEYWKQWFIGRFAYNEYLILNTCLVEHMFIY